MIVMVGLPGSGKSFFAQQFAETFRAPYVDRNRVAMYVHEDAEAADQIVSEQLDELLKTQQSIIVEGVSDTRTGRSELARRAKAAGYETLFIWVQTDPVTAKDRSTKITKNSTGRMLTPEAYDQAVKRFTPPAAAEKPVVISGKHTYATQAKAILKKLSSPRAEISKHTAAPVRPDQPTRRNITIR